ncbi:hypothetical protein K469DRAFT_529538, partial [Zopfia rhizophila CBS 207.26]
LRIVHDDSNDWQSEAQCMGTIHANAQVTIAAAGAADSREGLLLSPTPRDQAVEIPHY